MNTSKGCPVPVNILPSGFNVSGTKYHCRLCNAPYAWPNKECCDGAVGDRHRYLRDRILADIANERDKAATNQDSATASPVTPDK